jgi:hypothetical protein
MVYRQRIIALPRPCPVDATIAHDPLKKLYDVRWCDNEAASFVMIGLVLRAQHYAAASKRRRELSRAQNMARSWHGSCSYEGIDNRSFI